MLLFIQFDIVIIGPLMLCQLSDCFNKIPVKGILFVLVILAIGTVLISIGAVRALVGNFTKIIPTDFHPLFTFFIMLLIASFSTEIFYCTPLALSR